MHCPEDRFEGHWAEISVQLLLEQHVLCIFLSEGGDFAFYQTRACSTAWSDFEGAWMSLDPFVTQLWAALSNACGPLQQGSIQMCLSAWPPPSPGFGTCRTAGTDAQLRSSRVRCLGDGGFLQFCQLCQVKISHRKICHGAFLDKYYKSCLLKMNQKARFHFVSMGLLFL